MGKNVQHAAIDADNANHNRDKLISMFDLNKFASQLSEDTEFSYASSINFMKDKVPERRTCKQANIPPDWCNCWRFDKNVSIRSRPDDSNIGSDFATPAPRFETN